MVWCGVDFEYEHRSSSPKREENRTHPLDGERLQKKRTKERKRRESSRSEWNYFDEKTREFPFNSKKGP